MDTKADTPDDASIKLCIAHAASTGAELHSMDISNAFLNAPLDRDVYIHPPKGYEAPVGMVLKLKRSLYGMKDSPKNWQRHLVKTILEFGLHKTPVSPCLFAGDKIVVLFYVDDILFYGERANEFASYMQERFSVRHTVNPEYFCGLCIEYREDRILLHQRPYLEKIIKQFGLNDSKSTKTPMEHRLCLAPSSKPKLEIPYRQLVGSLIYATRTRPDISHAEKALSSVLHSYDETYFRYAKRVLKYLRTTIYYAIENPIKPTSRGVLECYVDADWAESPSRRSTTGFIILLDGCPATWKSKTQSTVAQSTTEAEIIAASEACKEMRYILTLLNHLGYELSVTPTVYIDNASALGIVNGHYPIRRTKHLDVRYFAMLELAESNTFRFQHVATQEQLADFLTKSLPRISFKKATDATLRGVLENQ